MGLLYAKDGKIYCSDYMELYIPKDYFDNGVASNKGSYIETFGVVMIKGFPGGNEGPIQMLKIPVIVKFMMYESRDEIIKVKDKSIPVTTLQYPKDSYVLHQSITKGREVAEHFLSTELNGKLPNTLNYADLIDLWWSNMEMAGMNYKVPSAMYEMIYATTYRDPNNPNRRYGQHYGRQTNPTGLDYAKENVRSVVRDLSTFAGFVFEDMSTMITNGINNDLNNVEEPESPLEKIIHY